MSGFKHCHLEWNERSRCVYLKRSGFLVFDSKWQELSSRTKWGIPLLYHLPMGFFPAESALQFRLSLYKTSQDSLIKLHIDEKRLPSWNLTDFLIQLHLGEIKTIDSGHPDPAQREKDLASKMRFTGFFSASRRIRMTVVGFDTSSAFCFQKVALLF